MKVSAAGLALLALCLGGSAFASEKIAIQAGCATCHAADRKVIGPSYREIAAKYKAQPNASKLLAERVRKGGQGVWGPVPMAPTPAEKLSDADLKAVVAWLLKTP
jgi:cytochrome c